MVLATASHASAQQVTDERIQELIREAAARAGVSRAVGRPGGRQARPRRRARRVRRPVVRMTLDDAIKLALDRNLDIAVQRLNPQTFDFSMASLQATYRPTLTSSINQQSHTNPSTQTIQGAGGGTGITQDSR